jgi:hypothetical protein
MQVLGNRSAAAIRSQPDIKQWADQTSLNPARVPPERAGDPDVTAAVARFAAHAGAGMTRLHELSDT